MREIDVAALTAVPEGEARGFEVEGKEIVLCNVDGEIYALQGMCTHEDLPLDGGEVEDGLLTCEWHGAAFDVCTGAAKTLPATRGLVTYQTRVSEGRIFLLLESTERPGQRAEGELESTHASGLHHCTSRGI